MRSCSLLLAALLVGGTSADLQAQMSGEAQQPETDEDKFVDAARHGRFQEVRDLHAKGVEPDYYNDATGAGYAAIHWSALNANAKMTRLLLSMGADVNLKHKSGNTALHYAALDGHPDVARVLIEAGADLDAVNNADFTPTDAATDTVEGRFRGPDQEHAQEVLDMLKDAREHPEDYGRPPNPPPKTKKRRKKKSDEL